MSQRIPVGVLGATGMVGQHFVKFLANHPWFEITFVGASDRSAGKKYNEATSWRLAGAMPDTVANLTVSECKPAGAPQIVFSAMDASVATEIEQDFAKNGHTVLSNSRNHRMEEDVPLLVPEINADHLAILAVQKKNRGWSGQIVTNPNCSTIVLTMALGPLKQFGITRSVITTMQAISGAGYPGVASMDITANVIPYIGSEEEKMEIETHKILGDCDGEAFTFHPMKLSATCNRVPVVDGHLVSVSVELSSKPSAHDVRAAIESFAALPQQLKLPSAPPRPVIYLPQQDRPQPRRDVERENGMAVFVGRLRPCPVFDWKFLCLGHNTVRGAAGASVLNAELMKAQGLV